MAAKEGLFYLVSQAFGFQEINNRPFFLDVEGALFLD